MSQQSFPFDAPKKDESKKDTPNKPVKGCISLPIHENLAEYASEFILNQLQDKLPDLSKVHILLSNNNAISWFRSVFLKKASDRGYSALLGPNIASIDNWASQQASVKPSVLSDHTRELLLVGALRDYPDIYKNSSPWALAESLMELFDELTLAHIELPQDIEEFKNKITEAYGSTQEVNATLGKEALLVHTLWYAMHQQLTELSCVDRISATLLNLGYSAEHIPEDYRIFYCGIDNPTLAENQWRKQLIGRDQLTLIMHNPNDCSAQETADNFFKFFDIVYDYSSASFFERTKSCKQLFPESPVQSLLRVFSSDNSEDEALGIDVQIRQWLLEGKRNIGIITENRKLARRVRALLERANVKIDDDAGWALSTTSAATVIERWLETVEQDFHYLPFLDFLKSPFVLASDEEFMETVFQLEQHIIVDENTASDITRFLRHIELRKSRLEDTLSSINYDNIISLLQTIKNVSQPLIDLSNTGKEYSASEFLDRLLTSLDELNITKTFSEDEAGTQLLSEINELKLAAEFIPTNMNWVAFRSWLGKALERFNFKPEKQSSPVKLTTLANSGYFQFDACIIAGAEQHFLPHAGKQSPFFNDSVRATLNIPTQANHQAINYYLFRRLLCSVANISAMNGSANKGRILITRRAKENGEEIIASPWIAALQGFHKQCYGTDLSDLEIPQFIATSASQVVLDYAPFPSPVPENPSSSIPLSLIPDGLSATDYQQLIDCPYQFFASRCLKLAAPDVVKEALQKSDYGNRVHRCLEAFHSSVNNLPGPFNDKVTNINRDDAITLLTEISVAVFSSDIEDNFLHRGWLNRWRQMIPLYIDWQIEQQKNFTPFATEVKVGNVELTENISIRGRIDRVDKQENNIAVIDYKTGYIPSEDDIVSGEAAQLPFYLLLLMTENAPQFANYLKTDNDLITAFYVDLYSGKKVSSKSMIQGQQLLELVSKNKHRLVAVMDQLRQGHAAPAWGSVDACKYCQMDVLCRKQAWN